MVICKPRICRTFGRVEIVHPIELPESKEKITELLNQEAPATTKTTKTKTRMVQAFTGRGKQSMAKEAEPQEDMADVAMTAGLDVLAPGTGIVIDAAKALGNGRRAAVPPVIPQDDEQPQAQQDDEMG